MRYAFKLFFVVLSVFILSSCSRTLGPNETNFLGQNMVRDFRLPQGYDVYHVYPNIGWSVRAGYEGLLSGSRSYADQKCGKGKPYNLTQIRIIPWRCCAPSLPPAQMGMIECTSNNSGGQPVFLSPMERGQAVEECKALGLTPSDKEFTSCVKELSS